MSETAPPRATLAFCRVDRARFADMARLFETRGAPKSCWCMAPRATTLEGRQRDKASRRGQMLARVEAGVPVGILGYAGEIPVAWCSIAPRGAYRNLGATQEGRDDVWSLACLFLLRVYRGRGYAGDLVAAAVAEAAASGASIVEAYPHEPDSPSYRYGGYIETFATLGFRDVGARGLRRRVMRLAIAERSR